jgi:putative ABC transport system permease protein
MRALQTLRLRLRSLIRRQRVESELDEELRYHVERQIEEYVARGMPEKDARRAAMREMGGLEQRKEECRDARGWGWLDDLAWDTRFALRTLRKAPLFSLTVIGSLALGIGATTAAFSAVNAILVRRLPYPDPDRLVWITHEARRLNETSSSFGVHFEDWSRHAQTVEAIAAFTDAGAILTGAGEPVHQSYLRVSPSFFPILGATMSRGRGFLPEEARSGGEPVVVISHGFWQGRLGSDPNAVGRLLRLDDSDVRVVGVLAPTFRTFTHPGDVWVPLTIDPATVRGGRQQHIRVLARLKPGVALQTAEAELREIVNVHEAGNENFRDGRVRLTRLQDHLASDSPRLLLILLGAVSLILLIACTNVANLLLARAAARQKEHAIFAALGAGRFRLVRRMLTECLILAAAAGALGLVLAFAIVRLSTTLSPPGVFILGLIENVATADLDRQVLAFTMAASLLSALVFGLAPALQFSRPDLTRSLKEGGGRDISARHRTRNVFVVVQVALALVLLIGAGLLLRSFVTLVQVAPGYRPDSLLTFRLELPKARYPEHATRARFQQQVLDRLRAVGGVETAAAATNIPLTGGAGDLFFGTEFFPKSQLQLRNVRVGLSSPGYFHAMGIALRQGRDFGERDMSAVPPVLIVTESLARQVFPNEDPLGKTLPMPTSIFKEPATIVGIVDDVARLSHRERKPELYLPFHQQWNLSTMTVVVRSPLDPAVLMPSLRREVHTLDSQLLIQDVKTMNERLAHSVSYRRFILAMLGLLATIALVLASGGVYGMIAYIVAQRTHEVGIRRALGAQPSDVVRLFVRQGMRLGLWGIALGLVAAVALSRVMTSLLFRGVSPTDPLTFASVAVLFMALVWASCWLPARRATRVAPVVALRQE